MLRKFIIFITHVFLFWLLNQWGMLRQSCKENENYNQLWSGSIKERNHMIDIDIDVRIRLLCDQKQTGNV
jgi:hypothetical protein